MECPAADVFGRGKKKRIGDRAERGDPDVWTPMRVSVAVTGAVDADPARGRENGRRRKGELLLVNVGVCDRAAGSEWAPSDGAPDRHVRVVRIEGAGDEGDRVCVYEGDGTLCKGEAVCELVGAAVGVEVGVSIEPGSVAAEGALD